MTQRFGSSSYRPLRIALVAPPWFTVPPYGYGGIERVVSLLADGLADLGHDVTLYAPEGSASRAHVRETMPPMHSVIGSVAVETRNVLAVYGEREIYDVVHDHTVAGLAVAAYQRSPVVHTVHGAVLPDIAGLYAALPRNVHLVAISESQRETLPFPERASLIYNSIDLEGYPYSDRPGEYLLFAGRAAPEKGPLDAIGIAEAAGLPLVVLLKVNEPAEEEYFEYLRPKLARCGAQVELGVTEARKSEAFAGALATLFPISWEEPFGLVMIESMAAGTPVIGYRRGSVPEIIADGKTGFIREDVASAARAVSRIGELRRQDCRDRVQDLFSKETAVARHEQLYYQLLDGRNAE